MDAEKPMGLPLAERPVRRWTAWRKSVVAAVLSAVILVIWWLLTPLEPYAALGWGLEFGSVQFSPNGDSLLTSAKKDVYGTFSGPLEIWDVEQGRKRFAVAHSWKEIWTVSFSPDGRFFAGLDRADGFKLWNATTGEEIASLTPEEKNQWVDFRFFPDGSYVAFQDNKAWPPDQFIAFWDVGAKRFRGRIESPLCTLAFADDSRAFATLRRTKDRSPPIDEALFWRMDGEPTLVKKHAIAGTEGVFSPGLMALVTVYDLPEGTSQIAMWDMAAGERRWTLSFKEGGSRLFFPSLEAKGRVLVAQTGRGAQMWDVSGAPVEIGTVSQSPPVPLSGGLVYSAPSRASSPDGAWLALAQYSGAKLIKVLEPAHTADLGVEGDWGLPSLSFSADGKMILATGLRRSERPSWLQEWLPDNVNPFPHDRGGPVVRLWDVAACREIANFPDCTDGWLSPDGKVVATMRKSKAVELWHLPPGPSAWCILGRATFALVAIAAGLWLIRKIIPTSLSRKAAPCQGLPAAGRGTPTGLVDAKRC